MLCGNFAWYCNWWRTQQATEGGEWEPQIRFQKIEEKKSLLHPTHLNQWVPVPHSSGRLSTLGTLTHRNQHKHAEAKQWRAQTKHAYSRNRTKADQSETIEKEYSENSNKEVSRQVKQKLEGQEINLTSKNTQDTNFCLLFQVLTKPYQKLINIDQRRRGLTRTN